VTIVILLVLVVVLWIVVLTPSAWRRLAERQGAGSIDHFHHQLALLEHAGPKIMAPAYRLHTAVPGGSPIDTQGPLEVDTGRPKLVLLRPVGDEVSADIEGTDGAHYERVGLLEAPEPPRCQAETRAELAAYRRQQARQRCTMLLRCLTGVSIATAVLGVFPTMRLAWIFTGLSGIALLGLVAMMGYAREIEGQQVRQRQRWATEDESFAYDDYYDGAASVGAAEAGYPGAWDDEAEEEFPRQAAGAG
jgi:hypothetical protein